MAVKYYYTSENKQQTKISGKVSRLSPGLNLDADLLSNEHASNFITKHALQYAVDEQINNQTTSQYLLAPDIISPINGATNVEYVELSINLADSIYSLLLPEQSTLSVYWEISTDIDFSVIIAASYEDYGNIFKYKPLLNSSTLYYARAKLGMVGIKSKWGSVISFTTGSNIVHIPKPTGLQLVGHTSDKDQTQYTPCFSIEAIGGLQNEGTYQYTEFEVYRKDQHSLAYGLPYFMPAVPVDSGNVTDIPSDKVFYYTNTDKLEPATEYIVKVRYVYTSGANTYKGNTSFYNFTTRGILNYTADIRAYNYADIGASANSTLGIAKLNNRDLLIVGDTASTLNLMVYDTFADTSIPIISSLTVDNTGYFDMAQIADNKVILTLPNGITMMYDHTTKIWTQVANWIDAGGAGTSSNASLIRRPNGDVYYMDFTLNASGANQIYRRYNTSTNTWENTTIPDMPDVRAFYNIGVLSDDEIIIMGGCNNTTIGTNVTKEDGYIYNFSTHIWTHVPNIPDYHTASAGFRNCYTTVELGDGSIVFAKVPYLAADGSVYARNYKYIARTNSWVFEDTDFVMYAGRKSVTPRQGVAYTYGSFYYDTISKIYW